MGLAENQVWWSILVLTNFAYTLLTILMHFN